MLKNNSDIVLVTGGAGYLGQHIVKHLLNDSRVKEIRILDTKRLADNQITTGKNLPALLNMSYVFCNL